MRFFLEQQPNYESRLYLSDEWDELKMPIACLDWKFREADFTGFRNFAEKLSLILQTYKIGQLALSEKDYEMQFLQDASHQMGTTRMAGKAEEGVVDNNCKVFDVDNLYVVGSSSFPREAMPILPLRFWRSLEGLESI